MAAIDRVDTLDARCRRSLGAVALVASLLGSSGCIGVTEIDGGTVSVDLIEGAVFHVHSDEVAVRTQDGEVVFDAGPSYHVLDVSQRHLVKRVQLDEAGTWDYSFEGTPALAELLMFLVDRDWPSSAPYHQLNGIHGYSVTGTVEGERITLRIEDTDGHVSSAVFGFDRDFALSSLSSIVWTGPNGERNVTHSVQVDLPDADAAAIALPSDSIAPTVETYSLDVFLAEHSDVGLTFPLHEAWGALVRDPRVWMETAGPASLVNAAYDDAGSGALVDGATWRIWFRDHANETFRATVVSQEVSGLRPVAYVTFLESAERPLEVDSYPAWTEAWGVVHEIAGTERGRTESVELLGPTFALTLWVDHRPSEGPFEEVQCLFDGFTGQPLHCRAGKMLGVW